MKASKAVKEIMNIQNVSLTTLAGRMNKSLRLVSDRLRAENITTSNLSEMLRSLDYELIIAPCGKINKSEDIFFVTDEIEKCSGAGASELKDEKCDDNGLTV